MIFSIWAWLGELFLAGARYVFRCIVCHIERALRADSPEEAKALITREGWRGPSKPGDPPGWRCSHCAGN